MFGIGFLNTIFLAALGATLLPVIIHILNRRRIRRIPFSSLRFLEEISQRRMRTVNVRRAIILLLRTLAVLFLVLAFARPVIRGAAAFFLSGEAPVYSVICLDTSYSMGVEREQGTAFSRAQSIAASVVDECGERDRLNLVLFSSRSEAVFDQGTRNGDLVKQAIRAAHVTHAGTDLTGAIAYAAGLIRESDLARGEIYVISDFRAVGDTTRVPADLGQAGLIFLPVYREAVDNSGIARVTVPRKLVRPGEVMKIGVAVTNYSPRQEARFPLELLVDGKRKAEKNIVLSPASTITVTFPLSLRSWGHYRCSVRKTRDRLALDDERLFLIDISRSVPVLLLHRSGRSDSSGTDSAFYIATALNPRTNAEGEFTVSHASERSVTAADLASASAVVWAGPAAVERSRLDMLIRHVRNGGAMAVFLDGADAAALRDSRFLEFIGAKSAAPRRTDSGGLTRFRSDHPVFSAFDAEELELLSRAGVGNYISVRGVPPDSVLAWMDNGDPYLWELSRGHGRLLVFASVPDLESGNIPLSPMFLPVIHTTMTFLADAARADRGTEEVVGGPLVFDLPEGLQPAEETLEIHTPDGFFGRPRVRTGPGGVARAVLDAPETVGFYSLMSDTSMIDEKVLNPDPVEANLEPADIGRLARDRARIVATGDRFSRNLLEARQGREIYAVFLLLALAALVAESLLGRTA